MPLFETTMVSPSMRPVAGTYFLSEPAISNPLSWPPLATIPLLWSNQTRIPSGSGVTMRYSGPENSIVSPYATARAARASLAPTSCLLVGCTSSGLPISMVTAIAVFL